MAQIDEEAPLAATASPKPCKRRGNVIIAIVAAIGFTAGVGALKHVGTSTTTNLTGIEGTASCCRIPADCGGSVCITTGCGGNEFYGYCSPAPAPAPSAPDPTCTGAGKDAWITGQLKPCCDDLEQCILPRPKSSPLYDKYPTILMCEKWYSTKGCM